VIANHVRRLKRDVGAEWERSGIAFLFHPLYWPYVDALKPKYVVFHAYDAFPLMDKKWTEGDSRRLSELCDRADIVSATTTGVISTLPKSSRARALILENGADVERFRPACGLQCPPELESIPRPRIGYIGTVNIRTDFDSINHVAQQHPDWHWVLLGDILEDVIRGDGEARAGYLKSRSLQNVHYLASVPSSAVPAYAGHMDVNTICYRIRNEEWVFMGYPVKLHEYLAVGKPVVSAPIEVIRDRFGSVVGLASTPHEWEAAIDRALHTGGIATPAQRRAVAEANTWDKRADQLDLWLREMLSSA
jgi:glycosyltransferase involved in cell wall biosynthesis